MSRTLIKKTVDQVKRQFAQDCIFLWGDEIFSAFPIPPRVFSMQSDAGVWMDVVFNVEGLPFRIGRTETESFLSLAENTLIKAIKTYWADMKVAREAFIQTLEPKPLKDEPSE
jgi:hypothetical protein